MLRRAFVAGMTAVTVARESCGQQSEKIYQVGIVTLGAEPRNSALWQGFIKGLRERNYIEGRNLTLRAALAEGRRDRLPALVAALVDAKVDVIATTSIDETSAAKRATSTIPIVMTLAPDPVGAGLVASLARPGGNVTGLTNLVPGVNQKYVELLKEAVPRLSRFVVLSTPGWPLRFSEIRRELEGAADRIGVTVVFAGVTTADDFETVLARAFEDEPPR